MTNNTKYLESQIKDAENRLQKLLDEKNKSQFMIKLTAEEKKVFKSFRTSLWRIAVQIPATKRDLEKIEYSLVNELKGLNYNIETYDNCIEKLKEEVIQKQNAITKYKETISDHSKEQKTASSNLQKFLKLKKDILKRNKYHEQK